MADLTTTAAVKAYAGVSGSGDDTAIGVLVTAISEVIAGVVGHDYAGATHTSEVYSGPVSGAIVLQAPAASITTVVEGTTTLGASDYELDGERLLYRKASSVASAWAEGNRNVAITYVDTSTVPADLELAARELGAWVLKQSHFDTGSGRLGLAAQANADSGAADYFAQALEELPLLAFTMKRYKRFA